MGTYAHRLTALAARPLPRRFIIFDGQPTISRELCRNDTLVHRIAAGSCRCLRRDGISSWSRWQADFTDGEELLTLLDRYSRRREVSWCIVNNLSYQWILCELGVAGFTGKLDVEGYNFTGRVQTARVRVAGKVVHMVDLQNYLDKPLDWIGDALGLRLPEPIADTEYDSAALDRARANVEIMAEFLMRLVALSGQAMDGAWGWSLGSLAWGSYRAGLMADPIYVHDDKEATDLERAAYLGGRTECRFIGAVKGKIHVVDYNSLYASCMQAEPMPVRLLGVHSESVDSLRRGLASGLCAIAQVTVHAAKHDYPYLIYPGKSAPRDSPSPLPGYCAPAVQWRKVWGRGRFTTTLGTPELFRALAAGEISSVGRTSWYESGDAFGPFVRYWYDCRLSHRARHRKVEEAITKRILTILPGKFGQHARDWTEQPEVMCQNITGHWWDWDKEQGTWRVYRALRGCAQVYGRPGEWKHACPAISAHVTSAARIATDDAVNVAGDYYCYYYNTDALHVTALGLDRLNSAGLIHDTQLGALKLEGIYDGGCYENTKRYRLGQDTGGIPPERDRAHAKSESESSLRDASALHNLFRAGSNAWKSTLLCTALGRFRYAGRVDPSGWIRPNWITRGPNGELPFWNQKDENVP